MVGRAGRTSQGVEWRQGAVSRQRSPARTRHACQFHHAMWLGGTAAAGERRRGPTSPCVDARDDQLDVGAIPEGGKEAGVRHAREIHAPLDPVQEGLGPEATQERLRSGGGPLGDGMRWQLGAAGSGGLGPAHHRRSWDSGIVAGSASCGAHARNWSHIKPSGAPWRQSAPGWGRTPPVAQSGCRW